jgi:predicted naringenin-chalcone synthase
MRADTLVFLHVLAGMLLVGCLFAAAVLSLAAQTRRSHVELLQRLAWRSALLAAFAAFATAALGEATRAREDVEGTWVDVGSGLAYIGLVVPGIVLAVLGYLGLTQRRLSAWVAGLSAAMIAVALATAFVMAAKPS